MKFFGDESFGAKQIGFQGCYTVAGYLASSAAWKVMTGDWQLALDQPPAIKYFRMSECYSAMEGKQEDYNKSQFATFSKREAKDKLDLLVSVLERHGEHLLGIGSAITWDCFEHALSDADKALFGSPYFFCVHGMIDGCRQMLRELKLQLPVSFKFDERTDTIQVHRAWDAAKKLGSPEDIAIMGEISFADDKLCGPLQCADLLAWHFRRDFIQPAEDHGRRRPEYLRLMNSLARWYTHAWNEEKLRKEREERWNMVDPKMKKKIDRELSKWHRMKFSQSCS